MMHFELYQDTASEWRWRLVAGNGNILAVSAEGYDTKAGAESCITVVRKVNGRTKTQLLPAGVDGDTTTKRIDGWKAAVWGVSSKEAESLLRESFRINHPHPSEGAQKQFEQAVQDMLKRLQTVTAQSVPDNSTLVNVTASGGGTARAYNLQVTKA